MQAQNQYLDYLIDPSFQELYRLFVLPFPDNAHQTGYMWYFLPIVEMKDYCVMIDGKYFFDQPVKNNVKTYDNIRKVLSGQGDDWTTGCLQDCVYFNNCHKMIAIDLSEQQALNAHPKRMQQINFTGNLDQAENTTMFFFGETKETSLDFWQGTVKSIVNVFYNLFCIKIKSLNIKLWM